MEQTKNVFCTIVTKSHVPYAQVLHHSLKQFNEHIQLIVLVVDEDDVSLLRLPESNIQYYSINDLQGFGHTKALIEKYGKVNTDIVRWSMKSVFVEYLLFSGLEKVIYIDADIFFFGDYSFLFDLLATNNILLTPHWRTKNPKINEKDFTLLLTEGIFNGGFIGASQGGQEALSWWSDACLWDCSKNSEKGTYDDQAYLNLMPVYFEKVFILNHRGLNVAHWNRKENKRSILKGEVLLNGTDPVIFIHFTKSTIKGITSKDKLLERYFRKYKEVCAQFDIQLK
jgi:lipopolysaccharide biosynthesis glycosyltransferase